MLGTFTFLASLPRLKKASVILVLGMNFGSPFLPIIGKLPPEALGDLMDGK